MTLVRRLVLCLALVSLAACGGGSGGGSNKVKTPTTFGKFRLINALVDSPPLTVKLGTVVQGTVSFSQSTKLLTEGATNYQLNVQYTTPGGTVKTVVDNRALTIAVNEQITFVLLGTLASVSVVELDENAPDIAAGDSEVRFVQSVAGGSYDFYLTGAGVDITTVGPTATVNALVVSDSMTVPSGANQRLRVTAAGDKTVLYDSGAFTLDDQARRLFLLGDYFGPGGDGVRAVEIDDHSATTFLAEDLPAALSIANEVVDLAGLDGYLHGIAGSPDFANVALDAISAAQTIPIGNTDVALTTAGTPGHVVVPDASFVLGTGETQTLVVAGVDSAGNVTTRPVTTPVRPIAGVAQVRVIDASPAAPAVDFFAVATGALPAAGKAQLTLLVLQASGVALLDPGSYDLYFTTGGTTSVVTGPQPITVAAGGIYSVLLADQAGGGSPVRIVVAD